jgi:hypothetical protein
MKPSAAALLTAAPPPVMKKLDHQQRSPASTTIPVGAVLKNIILKPAAVPPTLLGNVNGSAAGDLLFDILHSGERIRIGHPQKKYEYVDSVASFIGRGSYGIVYKGIQRVTKNAVAIKVWFLVYFII